MALRRLLAMKHLHALKAMKRPTEHWDDLIMHLLTSWLDPKINRTWEVASKQEENATFGDLTDFLTQHCKALEASSHNQRPVTAIRKTQGELGVR